jgi:hypothetical protein
MNRFLGLLAICLIGMLPSEPAHAMSGASTRAATVDPPVVLSNNSDRALIVRWQTSIPGVAASPVDEHVLPAGTAQEHLKHANFWVAEPGTTGETRSVPNMIEIWVYAEDAPDLLLSYFRTFRDLYPYNLREEDKTVIMEIDIFDATGIDVKLETFR